MHRQAIPKRCTQCLQHNILFSIDSKLHTEQLNMSTLL